MRVGKRHADTVPHTERGSFAGPVAAAVALQDARARSASDVRPGGSCCSIILYNKIILLSYREIVDRGIIYRNTAQCFLVRSELGYRQKTNTKIIINNIMFNIRVCVRIIGRSVCRVPLQFDR